MVNSSRIKNEIIPQTLYRTTRTSKKKNKRKKDYNEVSSVNQNKGTMEERLEELKKKRQTCRTDFRKTRRIP